MIEPPGKARLIRASKPAALVAGFGLVKGAEGRITTEITTTDLVLRSLRDPSRLREGDGGRLEGWQPVRPHQWPSFETRRFRGAPQDEVRQS